MIMTKLSLIIVLFSLGLTSLHAQEPTPATEAGEDFDLNAVMLVMETAEDLADLEKKINDSENQINNLDLNKDDEIDIVKIVEFDEEDIRVLALRAIIGDNDYQDVATIEIEKHSDTEISLQIIGDPDLYGADYILEPAPEEKNSGSHGAADIFYDESENLLGSSVAVFVSVHRWRPIRPLFVVGRVAFVSAVVWRPVPVWFVVRRPIARSTWRGRSRRYRNNRYRSTRNRHSRNANKVYSNNRKKSTTAKKNVGPKPTPSSKTSANQANKSSVPSDKAASNKKKTTTSHTSGSQQKSMTTSSPAAKKSPSQKKKSGPVKR